MGHRDLLVTQTYPFATGARVASAVRLSCVPGMLSSLEVKVLRPTWWRWRP